MTFESWRPRAKDVPHALALLAAALVGWLLGDVGLAAQLAVLMLALTLFAVPQALRDPEIGRDLFDEGEGLAWTFRFFALYGGLAAIVLCGWLAIPSLTFLIVLVLAGARLGRLRASAYRQPRDRLVMLTFGTLPFVLVGAFHPDEVGTIWAWITRRSGPDELVNVVRAAAPLFAVVWCTLAGLVAGRLLHRRRSIAAVAELVLALLLFGLAPPMIALAAYLIIAQAIPRWLELAARFNAEAPWRGLAKCVRRGAPFAGAAIVLTGFSLVLARVMGATPGEALAIVAVWSFGAFIVPHVVVRTLDPERSREGDFFEAEGLLERAREMLSRGRRRRVVRYGPRGR